MSILRKIAGLLVLCSAFWAFPSHAATIQQEMVFNTNTAVPIVRTVQFVGPKQPPVILGPAKPKPKPRKVVSATSPNTFVKGNCTWYVASKVDIDFKGHAKDWLANAQATGYVTGTIPEVGAVVSIASGNKYGHVAYVESISGINMTISEMNVVGLGIVNKRTMSVTDPKILGYIYSK